MKCAVHTDVDATGFCRNCGKAMCGVCVRPVKDVLYCEDCLATLVGHNTPAGQTQPSALATPTVSTPTVTGGHSPNPVLAGLLGFLPGFGAFYNEQYTKGLIFIAVFLVLFISGVNADNLSDGAEAAIWLLISGLWLYMPIDAYRTAHAKRSGQPISDPLESLGKNRPVGPVVLIGVGLLLLLNNFYWFPWYRFSRLWPILLIGAGLLMFRNRLSGRSQGG